MNQILAQGSQGALERSEGGFGETFSDIMPGLQNINDALGGSGGGKDFQGIVSLIISSILNPVVALLVGAAVVYFMWGVLTYVKRGSEEGDREKGIQMMSYGIMAIFVMVSVWGLVYILINTFQLGNPQPPIPVLQ